MGLTIIETSDGLIAAQDSEGRSIPILREKFWGPVGQKERNKRARHLRDNGWTVEVKKLSNPFGGLPLYILTATKEEEG